MKHNVSSLEYSLIKKMNERDFVDMNWLARVFNYVFPSLKLSYTS